MRYLALEPVERSSLLEGLKAMPAYLEAAFGALSPDAARLQGPNGASSPVEQAWHLADLEREGYAVRIERLLGETAPELPDFDGARVALERRYKSLSLDEGLRAFRSAREANIARLLGVRDDQWERAGRQEGVGRVALRDLPAMMAEHDASHRSEIEAWLRSQNA